MDADVVKLCKEIYDEHKEAIDLIYSIGNQRDMSSGVPLFRQKFPDVVDISVRPREFTFSTPDLYLKKPMSTSWANGQAVCFWFGEYYGRLKIHFEIGPFEHPANRISFLESIEQAGIRLTPSAKQPGRSYTRIYTNTSEVKDWTDPSSLATAMISLYENPELKKVEKLIVPPFKAYFIDEM